MLASFSSREPLQGKLLKKDKRNTQRDKEIAGPLVWISSIWTMTPSSSSSSSSSPSSSSSSSAAAPPPPPSVQSPQGSRQWKAGENVYPDLPDLWAAKWGPRMRVFRQMRCPSDDWSEKEGVRPSFRISASFAELKLQLRSIWVCVHDKDNTGASHGNTNV